MVGCTAFAASCRRLGHTVTPRLTWDTECEFGGSVGAVHFAPADPQMQGDALRLVEPGALGVHPAAQFAPDADAVAAQWLAVAAAPPRVTLGTAYRSARREAVWRDHADAAAPPKMGGHRD